MIDIDSYSGADDDMKLDKAMVDIAGSRLDLTFDRPLRLAKKRPPFRGVLQGRGRATPVTLDFDSRDGIGAFHAIGPLVKQMQLRDVMFVGNGTKDQAHPALLTQDKNSPGFQQLITWNLITTGLLSTYGTAAQRLLLTACTLDGPECDINNGWDTSINLGGSDNVLWTCGLLLDSPSSVDGAGHEPGASGMVPHLKVGYLDKTRVGRIYCTAAGRWRALDFDGQQHNSGSPGGNGGPVVFDALVQEGRNKTKPCDDAVVVVRGGLPVFREPWWGYTKSPLGAVQCLGGLTRITNPTYGNAAGVSPDVPMVYASGAQTVVAFEGRAAVGSQAGVWPVPKPRYRAVNGAQVALDGPANGSLVRLP